MNFHVNLKQNQYCIDMDSWNQHKQEMGWFIHSWFKYQHTEPSNLLIRLGNWSWECIQPTYPIRNEMCWLNICGYQFMYDLPNIHNLFFQPLTSRNVFSVISVASTIAHKPGGTFIHLFTSQEGLKNYRISWEGRNKTSQVGQPLSLLRLYTR